MTMKKTRTKTSSRTNFVTQNLFYPLLFPHNCYHMGMGIIYIYIYISSQVNKNSSKQKRKTSVWILTLLASLTQTQNTQKKKHATSNVRCRWSVSFFGAVRPKTSGSPVASSHTRRSNCQTYFDLCVVCCFPSFGEGTKGLLLCLFHHTCICWNNCKGSWSSHQIYPSTHLYSQWWRK